MNTKEDIIEYAEKYKKEADLFLDFCKKLTKENIDDIESKADKMLTHIELAISMYSEKAPSGWLH